MRKNGQAVLDAQRRVYDVVFPAQMDEKQIHAFIRSIGSNLRGGSTWGGVPTMVFSVMSSAEHGIRHRLRVPEDSAAYLTGQLQNAIPGIEITEVESIIRKSPDYEPGYQFGATIHMANPAEELPIIQTVDFANRLVASMQEAIQPHDAVTIQWVIAHSNNQKQPPSDKAVRSQRSGILSSVFFPNNAGRDEIHSRQAKQQDQNFIAIGRIAARGRTVHRARELVEQVVRALTSEGGQASFYARAVKPQQISRDIRLGTTPLALTAQLNVKELAAVIGWPVGDGYVPRLQRGSLVHMPPTEMIPRAGRILGLSTMPGQLRTIAMPYDDAVKHLFIGGNSGTGKTPLVVNIMRQDMERGCGGIMIERDGNLFRQALDQVPADRAEDVICIDLSRADRPLGLNLLRLNKPEVVAGQLADLLESLYDRSVYTNELVRHGIPVLANLERATIADLLTLVHPRNPAEKAWVKWVISQIKDPVYRDFWEDWHRRDEKKIVADSQPLKNRLWEILTPEATRYLVNQETNSFEPADVVNKNKLLFVNLAGASDQVASLIGTMIVTAIWTAAKHAQAADNLPDKPNFMYIDEFHQFSHLGQDFRDMLATARKCKLGLVIATQYIDQLAYETKDAVMANARTKIIFNSSSKAAGTYAMDFGRHVTADSFINLKAYDTIARVMVNNSVSDPITMHTVPEPGEPGSLLSPGYGKGKAILDLSARTYGRSIDDINHDDSTRRIAPSSIPSAVRTDVSRSTRYNPGR